MDQLLLGVGPVAAIIAGAALNMRILLITASMEGVMRGRSWWHIGLGTFLATDASVALMQTAKSRVMTIVIGIFWWWCISILSLDSCNNNWCLRLVEYLILN